MVLTGTENIRTSTGPPEFGSARSSISSRRSKSRFRGGLCEPQRRLYSGRSAQPRHGEPVDWEWYQNKAFMNRLGATLKPSEVDPADYAAIYFVGGHGVLWDFAR